MTTYLYGKDEWERLQRKFSRDNIDNTLYTIARWPDFTFETADGRTFAYFEDGDSILHRLEALHVKNFVSLKEMEWIARQHGAIAELGCEEQPPMWYSREGDYDEFPLAWLELHRLYDVPLNEEEAEWFGDGGYYTIDDDE